MIFRKKWIPYLVLATIFLFAFLVRFYNFSNRINFGPEQAISLIVSGDYIQDKITLLGDPNVQRVTSTGLRIFHLPIFNYSLVPLLLIFNFDPLPVTFYFGLLNIFTGFILFFITKKIFNIYTAIFAAILFLFNSVMINYSLFIWNQHYIPLLSALSILMIYKIRNCSGQITINAFLLGLFSGLIFGVQYLYAVYMIIITTIILYKSKSKILILVGFFSGIFVSLLPMFLFDIKHDFYYIRTLIQYFADTFQNTGQSKISMYHFLPLWPVVSMIIAFLIFKIFQKNKIIAMILISIYLYINLTSSLISFTKAVGMNEGLNYNLLNTAAKDISKDNPKQYNVATTWDFDSQAHPLRYLLQFRYKTKPAGIEEYKNVGSIYVMTNPGYDFYSTNLFEIAAFRPFQVELLAKVSNDYSVFKLSH